MRFLPQMICAVVIVGTVNAAPAMAATGGESKRCCESSKGPDPVDYTGKWLPGMFTREKCVAKKYGFWEGDVPNVAKKVCALRTTKTPPDYPVIPPHQPPAPPPTMEIKTPPAPPPKVK